MSWPSRLKMGVLLFGFSYYAALAYLRYTNQWHVVQDFYIGLWMRLLESPRLLEALEGMTAQKRQPIMLTMMNCIDITGWMVNRALPFMVDILTIAAWLNMGAQFILHFLVPNDEPQDGRGRVG